MVVKTKIINSKALSNKDDFIISSENKIQQELTAAAKTVVADENKKPLILISGPSGSGKTTTAIKLNHILKSMGKNVCYLSMDKYFKNFSDEEKRLKALGKIDLESPNRVDTQYINNDISILLDGGQIDIPIYNFASNTRAFSGKKLSRNGGFVIIEGIHALNPDVLGDNDDCSNKIYVSVRTRVEDSQHDILHPCKIRLMRRMLRDKLYRGRDIADTIKMFPHVQRGENKYILPYKNRSDIDIDTFIEYEPCLYRNYLYNELMALAPEKAEVRDIIEALDEIVPITSDTIPGDAMMREFIGNSSLSY